MKPLLAHTYEPHRVSFPCYVQPKLNGVRALYQNGRFQSREELPFPEGLLDHVSRPLREVFGPETILDGELYVHGWPLQRILAAVTPVAKRGPTEDTLQVEYHVFDVVNFDQSFEERNNSLLCRLKHLSPVHGVLTSYVKDEQQANEKYVECVTWGYEGMMYRLGDCPYTHPKQPFYNHVLGAGTFGPSRARALSDKHNRCWHLLKRKDWQDDEFDFVSIERTVGRLGEPGFVMWCKAKNGLPFKFGSGLSQSEVDHYIEHPPVGRKIKGKYLVLSADGIPLNGTILAVL